MGHKITAIIAQAPINEASAIARGLPVIYEGNYVIIPVPVELIWKLAGDDEPADGAATTIFNTQVPHQLAKELYMASYALIETDYFGGVGEQNASFHGADGSVLRDVSLNEALRALGVQRKPCYIDPPAKAPKPSLFDRIRSWWEMRPYISKAERSNMYPENDEFDMINLGSYRQMVDARFWAEGKSGQRIGNILVGDRRIMD